MPAVISRRKLLLSASLAATAAIAPPVLAQRPSRILIVGAGPAGLTAAYDLLRAGLDVQVFEASNRAGGRMHTLREPFTDGLYAEAGAQLLLDPSPGSEFAREFGLEMLPVPFDASLGSLSYLRGQRIEHRPGDAGVLPFDLSPEERGLSVTQLHVRYRNGPIGRTEGLAQLAPPQVPAEQFRQFDEMSLLDLWQSEGASSAAIDVMMNYYVRAYADSPDQINVMQLMRETASFIGMQGGYTVAGGNDGICRALAERLGGRVHFESPVRAVEQNAAGVTLRLDGVGGTDSVTGDLAILTPPPPVLRTIDFQPALSDAAAGALRSAIATPVTMTYAQTRSRFWRDQGLNGTAITDLPAATIQDLTNMQSGENGILASMTYSAQAQAMAALSPDERQQRLREALESLYPDSLALEEIGTSYAWGDDPWHRCGHVTYRPGTYIDTVAALREPQGRVYFAGDTMGGVSGYSHTAFASGREVATAIASAA